ncbi:hypothetical protein KAR26_04095 [Candidatus Parcubacteria bacterium]|nr:hypothetical protein [Candidatus Parcubacteria bacterium]
MKKYIPLVQQSHCCVPACIQMILLRRNIPLISQEDIGYNLGLIVSEKYKSLFQKVRTGKKPISGWGTQVGRSIYSINNFFKKHKIDLKENYFFLCEPEEIRKFLKENLDKDIIVCYNYPKLYDKKVEVWGAVAIIENIKGDCITLIDPGYTLPKYRKVSLKKLSEAIKIHGEARRAGFWIIS